MAIRGASAIVLGMALTVVLLNGVSSGQNLSLSGTPALNSTLPLTLTGPPGYNYFIGVSTSPGPSKSATFKPSGSRSQR